jgi:molybdate transport system ATP-binding protein
VSREGLRATVEVERGTFRLDVDLAVERGEILAVLGPNGSGKSTLLRALCGLLPVDRGRIVLDGVVLDDRAAGTFVPPEERPVGVVFQDHLLFDHLSALDNVAFGLRARGVAKATANAVAHERLSRLGLGEFAATRPHHLSGGQAQRVALARALAPRPRLLLLDEPLSALDAPTRSRLRVDLREVLVRSGTPTLLVSHDRTEVLTLADRVAVVVGGRVLQVGSPAEVFGRPADAAVAHVVGVETATPGVVRSRGEGVLGVEVGSGACRLTAAEVPGEAALGPGDEVLVCIRAEDVALELPGRGGPSSPRNHLPGTVTAVAVDGPLVRVDVDCGFPLAAYITRPAREELGLVPGSAVVASVKGPAVHLVPHPQ